MLLLLLLLLGSPVREVAGARHGKVQVPRHAVAARVTQLVAHESQSVSPPVSQFPGPQKQWKARRLNRKGERGSHSPRSPAGRSETPLSPAWAPCCPSRRRRGSCC